MPRALFAQTAEIAAVTPVHLLFFLAAGQLDLGRIDDDDVVAGVDERGIGRLVLALKQPGGPGGDAAEDLALGIDDVPPAGHGLRGCDVRTHANGSLRLSRRMTANPNDTTSWRNRQDRRRVAPSAVARRSAQHALTRADPVRLSRSHVARSREKPCTVGLAIANRNGRSNGRKRAIFVRRLQFCRLVGYPERPDPDENVAFTGRIGACAAWPGGSGCGSRSPAGHRRRWQRRANLACCFVAVKASSGSTSARARSRRSS